MDYKRQKHMRARQIISMPIIWSVLIPILFLHIIIEIYHQISFRLYKLPRVKFREHIRIDRHKLPYLTFAEKLGCGYCGYANGFFSYITEIGARTEAYWCGIMHEKLADRGFKTPEHHKDFVLYDDEEKFRERYLSRDASEKVFESS